MAASRLKHMADLWVRFGKTNPMARGMVSYAVAWPLGSLAQQTIDGKRWKNYDWLAVLRFSIYGGLYVGSTLYGWVRITSAMWPETNFRTGLMKAAVEAVSYRPYQTASFFIGTSMLAFKTIEETKEELRNKFVPTLSVALCIWPVAQMVNFSLIPERNRVIFASIVSLFWTTFLAFMKKEHAEDIIHIPHHHQNHHQST